MFAHNLKDKLILVGFFLIIDLIFYPWLSSMILVSISEYIITEFVPPTLPILNWVSVFENRWALQLFLIIHLSGVVLFVIYNPYRQVSFDLKYDSEGKPIALKTGEHGTARLATYKELKEKNKSYLPSKTTNPNAPYPLKSAGLILSSIFLNNKKDVEVVYMDKDVHSIILGATGSGKTTSFIKPTILTIADAGESMIIHDPKGELKRDYAGYLREVKGYDVIEMNYADPRSGDQFNQLENVVRRLKKAQESNIKWHTCRSIIKYLEHINTDGESMGQKSADHRYSKLKISSDDGNLALQYIREFFVVSFGKAWDKIDDNFYIYYRKERIAVEALKLLRNYTVKDVADYIDGIITKTQQFLNSITSDISDSADAAKRKIRMLESVKREIAEKESLSISMIIKYFSLMADEFKNNYKDEEAEANIYARSIASMLVDGSGGGDRQKGEKIWEDTPKALLTSIIMFVARETHLPTSAHMGSVYRFVSDLTSPANPNRPNNDKTMMDVLFESFLPEDPCRLSQAAVRIAGDKTKSSIYVSAVAPIEIFTTPAVVEQGSRTSFDMRSIAKKPTAVFVLSAGRDENPIFSVLTSLFMEQTYISLVEQTRETESLRLPIRVNYLLDELGNMAPIPELGSKVSLARSRGIRFNFVLQSFTQLDTHYKVDKNNIMENTSWFYLLTQDYETAKQISDRIGSYTADAQSESLNANSPDNITGGASKQKMARPLYTPDEIMRFKVGTGLAIVSSDYPAKVNLLPDFSYPQASEVSKFKAKEIVTYRPKQEMNIFVPQVNHFVEGYKLFNSDELFDDFWTTFNNELTLNKDEASSKAGTTDNPQLDIDMNEDIMMTASKRRQEGIETPNEKKTTKPTIKKKGEPGASNRSKKPKEPTPGNVTDVKSPNHPLIMAAQRQTIFEGVINYSHISAEDANMKEIAEIFESGIKTNNKYVSERSEEVPEIIDEYQGKVILKDFALEEELEEDKNKTQE